MYYLYILILVFLPSTLAQADPEDPYEYNWKFKDYEPHLSPTWRSRRTRVEGYPHYEERLIKDYLSQMISGRIQAAQGSVGLTGGDGSSEDEWLPPPPRHRPQYKQPIASPQFTYHTIDRPIEHNIPQFAVPPSDSRFFDNVEVRTLTPLVQMSGYPSSVDLKMTANDPQSAYHNEETTEDDDQVFKTPLIDFNATRENMMFIALVIGCSIGAVSGIALIVYGFVRLQRNAKAAADVEYPAYGVTGPNKEATPTGDRRLAHSAQMYHYQLTKQQIIAMESSTRGERRGSLSEADSDDENEEGDYTVYECPGLAPTGEMEVKNPLFQDDPTPAQTNNLNNDQQQQQNQPTDQELSTKEANDDINK